MNEIVVRFNRTFMELKLHVVGKKTERNEF